MGTACATICSSDGEAEKKAKEIYMSSRPEPKKVPSQSTTYTYDETEESETDTNHKQLTIDSKTIELLTPLNNTENSGKIPPNYIEDKYIPNATNAASDNELEELERNITTSRVKTLTEIIDPKELQNIITQQYSIPSDDDSSLSETDKQEIKDRKESLNPKKYSHETGPSLYRDTTAHDWDEDDIDVLTNDMEKQLLLLKKDSVKSNTLGVPNNSNKNYKITVGDSENNIGQKVVDAKIFRSKSAHKWDMDDIEATKEDMQKEMMNLMLINQENKAKESDAIKPRMKNGTNSTKAVSAAT